MLDGSAGEGGGRVRGQGVTILSCGAVLLMILVAGPSRPPLPGTRTALELLSSASERGHSRWSVSRNLPASQRF
jgi:hypothetical protein